MYIYIYIVLVSLNIMQLYLRLKNVKIGKWNNSEIEWMKFVILNIGIRMLCD